MNFVSNFLLIFCLSFGCLQFLICTVTKYHSHSLCLHFGDHAKTAMLRELLSHQT